MVVDEAVYGLVGSYVILSGSATDADEGDVPTLNWEQTGGPEVTLDDDTLEMPRFLPTQVGEYVFSLTANDTKTDSEPVTSTAYVHDIDGGEDFTLALRPDGTLLAWGDNREGQLGNGTRNSAMHPGRVCAEAASDCDGEPLENIVAISAGRSHSLALDSEGQVWAWGLNADRQLGNGAGTPRGTRPTRVCDTTGCGTEEVFTPLSDVVAISAGYLFSLALKADGTVYAWGWNGEGQLGIGTTTPGNSSIPRQVCRTATEGVCDSVLGGVEFISAGGGGHSLAGRPSGNLYAWGHNKSGQIGVNSTDVVISLPAQVCGMDGEVCNTEFFDDIVLADAWSGNSFGLRSDGSLWGWGGNSYGQLGNVTDVTCPSGSSCTQTPIPVCTSELCADTLDEVISFEAGRRFTLAVTENGRLWVWGDDNEEQLGNGVETGYGYPITPCALPRRGGCEGGLSNIAAVAAGSYHALALTRDGQLLSWGDNQYGQVGDDEYYWDTDRPTVVPGYADVPGVTDTAEGPCEAQIPPTVDLMIWKFDEGLSNMDDFCVNFKDDRYDGTRGTMRCVPLYWPFTQSKAGAPTVEVWVEHESIGELVFKLESPDGTVYPLVSRPGLNEPTDDGTESGGSTADLSFDWPVRFDTDAETSAEDMDAESGFICQDTTPCTYAPDPGAVTPANDLDDLGTYNAKGDWLLCVGDAGDSGVGGITAAEIVYQRVAE